MLLLPVVLVVFRVQFWPFFPGFEKKGKFKQEKGTQITSKLDDPLLE